jgi:K+-transporting ATPase KdpF subunit
MKLLPEIHIFAPLYQRRFTRYLILACLFNLALAPLVQASTGATVSREQSFALGLLIIGTIALSIYLFVVIFQPEKF